MKRQLISTEVWVFIAVLVISIIIVIIYHILAVDRPSDLEEFNNLNPFPTIRMENLPSPKFISQNVDITNCANQVLPCDTDNDCSQQCGANYTCTQVEDSENLVYNGIKVGEGTWCLPKNKLQGCGKYTGQTVWSGEESGTQGWQCICKYPSLFGGPEDPYCIKKLACQDPNDEAQGLVQSNNNLVNSKGEVYDPNLPNFYPPDGIANPYALDKDGKPVYTCRCGVGTNNRRFVSLPNDPQGCNLEPCTPSNTSPLWNSENQTCICNIDGIIRKDGICQQAVCPYGSWNPLTQQCDCLKQLGKMRCNPEGGEKIWTDAVPKCDDSKNITGWQCINRCITNYCDKDKDVTNCGGEDGYRPEFFEDGNAVVCIGGNCAIDLDNPEKSCCNCPSGTIYQNDKTDKGYGNCQGQSMLPGEGCYIGGRYPGGSKKKYDKNSIRKFWVSYGEDEHEWKAAEIDYKDTNKVPVNPKVWIESTDEAAKKACDSQCLSKNIVATSEGLANKLNDMQKAYVKNAPNDVDDKNKWASEQIGKKFTTDYCVKAGDYRWKGFEYVNGVPQFFGHDPDWACGYMCDGTINPDLSPDEVPTGQCENY